jgi:hypothetical protein
MEPPELIQGLGQVLRAAARESGDDYRRSQLLSAYSLSRHLAAEQVAAPGMFTWLREGLDRDLAETTAPAAASARAALAGPAAEADVGTVLARLFAELGDGADEEALRRRLHSLLADLTDREVAVLAAAEA